MSRPVARPVAQVAALGKPRSGPGFPQIRTRKDSLPARPSRISALQLDRIDSSLNDLDISVLSFVGGVRLASGKQLVRRFWRGDSDSQARQARRALKRLADWRVLDPLPGRARGGTRGGSDTLIYGVGPSGARLITRRGPAPRRLGTPGDRYIAHTLTVTELVVRAEEAARRGDLEIIEVQTEPACWRPFVGTMGARLTLKPDLFVRVAAPGSPHEDRWLVEVDMATEHKSTLAGKAGRYLAHYRSGSEQHQHGVYPRVLWAVPNAHRAQQITDILHRLPTPAERLFSICLLDEVVAFMATEARS
jgi:Replication-relaxation